MDIEVWFVWWLFNGGWGQGWRRILVSTLEFSLMDRGSGKGRHVTGMKQSGLRTRFGKVEV